MNVTFRGYLEKNNPVTYVIYNDKFDLLMKIEYCLTKFCETIKRSYSKINIIGITKCGDEESIWFEPQKGTRLEFNNDNLNKIDIYDHVFVVDIKAKLRILSTFDILDMIKWLSNEPCKWSYKTEQFDNKVTITNNDDSKSDYSRSRKNTIHLPQKEYRKLVEIFTHKSTSLMLKDQEIQIDYYIDNQL